LVTKWLLRRAVHRPRDRQQRRGGKDDGCDRAQIRAGGGIGAKPGQFYRPASSWSIYARSKAPEVAAAFIAFFLNDPEAAKVLGVERGVPMAPATRELILPTLKPVERATVDYVNFIADKLGPYPAPPPKGSQQFGRVLKRVADTVAFGNASVADGAAQLATLIGWLTLRADATTGLWSGPVGDDWLQPVNGFYRLTRGTYAQFGLPLPWPERTIDAVLAHLGLADAVRFRLVGVHRWSPALPADRIRWPQR
jgi:hypothetical protein